MLRTLPVLVLGLAAVACVPQEPFSPLAVESGEQGTVRILQTDCTLDEIVSVEVIAGNDDQSLDDKDTRIWRVDFKPAAKIRAFETGVVPEGGEEHVPWREPEPDQLLTVLVRTASGLEFTEDFSLKELGKDKVRYHFKTLTRDQFDKEAPCAAK